MYAYSLYCRRLFTALSAPHKMKRRIKRENNLVNNRPKSREKKTYFVIILYLMWKWVTVDFLFTDLWCTIKAYIAEDCSLVYLLYTKRKEKLKEEAI